jgi:hypothetical protein
MDKKAVITISLVEESGEKANDVIEREIVEELSGELPKIPWFKSVEKVTVEQSACR